MYQFVKVTFTAGLALAMVSVATWRAAGMTVPPNASVLSAPVHWRTIPRCGVETPSTLPMTPAPLPNAYMLANGQLFALADVFACVNRLHTARFSYGQVGAVWSSRHEIPNPKAPIEEIENWNQ